MLCIYIYMYLCLCVCMCFFFQHLRDRIQFFVVGSESNSIVYHTVEKTAKKASNANRYDGTRYVNRLCGRRFSHRNSPLKFFSACWFSSILFSFSSHSLLTLSFQLSGRSFDPVFLSEPLCFLSTVVSPPPPPPPPPSLPCSRHSIHSSKPEWTFSERDSPVRIPLLIICLIRVICNPKN